jgi:hypothetical protein
MDTLDVLQRASSREEPSNATKPTSTAILDKTEAFENDPVYRWHHPSANTAAAFWRSTISGRRGRPMKVFTPMVTALGYAHQSAQNPSRFTIFPKQPSNSSPPPRANGRIRNIRIVGDRNNEASRVVFSRWAVPRWHTAVTATRQRRRTRHR